jgi:hypothetical protein
LASGEEVPVELAYLARYRAFWYVGGPIALILSALLVGHIIPTRDYGGWLTWLGNALQAVYVTLTLFLVVLTYKLFRIAAMASAQSERVHRIGQLPVVVADIMPLADDYTHKLWLTNEGSGPAFDVLVDFDYRPKVTQTGGRQASDTLEIASDEFVRVGVIKKEGACGPLFLDMKSLLIRKPWGHFNFGLDRYDFPGKAETARLLADFSLVIRVSYKDIYGKRGHSTYEALFANGELGFELVQLQPPPVEAGATVEAIRFERRERVELRFKPEPDTASL